MTDLLGGHIPMAFAPIPASHPNVSAGTLRALAVTSTTRSNLLPDVPTMAEAGLPGFDASLYYGLVAPAGTPRPVIDKLNKQLQAALASAEVKKQLGLDGTEITPGTPEDYAGFIDKDEKKWSQLVKASGVEPE
jgi:tripartite-type tricarboxylate transporter receptor subunit TctC